MQSYDITAKSNLPQTTVVARLIANFYNMISSNGGYSKSGEAHKCF